MIMQIAAHRKPDSAYGNRFMFTGREYLSTIGIYDYRNRMYSPLIGRFLQTDLLGLNAGDNNIYRYVGNNPVNAVDQDGTIARRHDDHYSYIVEGGHDYLESLVGARVRVSIKRPCSQCAGTTQVLGGGYDGGGKYRDVPQTRTRMTIQFGSQVHRP